MVHVVDLILLKLGVYIYEEVYFYIVLQLCIINNTSFMAVDIQIDHSKSVGNHNFIEHF